jgi:hypothetical protein
MPQRFPKRKPKPKPEKEPPSRFAPAAFLKGSAEQVQALCDELATIAADRFSDLTGTTWQRAGTDLAQQLRAAGHDLMNLEDDVGLQEWQATFYHPRGNFSLLLSFRAPYAVEVTWKTDDATFTALR